MRKIYTPISLITLLITGCSGTAQNLPVGSSEDAACDEKTGCQSPLVCVEGLCKNVCTTDAHCAKNQICQDGICITQASTMCLDDSDCKSPSQCEMARNAYCEGAKCHYLPKVAGESCNDDDICTTEDVCDGNGNCQGTAVTCNEPPTATCSEDDTTYQTYKIPGTCITADNKGCIYEEFNQPCNECLKNCAGFCENVQCPQNENSCKINTCDPHSTDNPPCSLINKADDEPCHFDANSDGLAAESGFCQDGQCRECNNDSQCTTPPNDWASCFTAQCENHTCQYSFNSEAACGSRCLDGLKYNAGGCAISDEEDLTSTYCYAQTTSCNNFQCDSAGKECLTSCQNDTECMPGFYCDAENKCVAKMGLTSACEAGNQCLSNSCVTGLCCENDCLDGICSPTDGLCRKKNGETCRQANDCGSGNCVDGYCCDQAECGTCQACNQPDSLGSCAATARGSMDDTCLPSSTENKLCDGSGHCDLLDGNVCTSDDQCYNEHCMDGFCCNSGDRPATTCSDIDGVPTETSYVCTANGKYEPVTTACNNYLKCNGDNSACLAACTQDSDCTNGACLVETGKCQYANGAMCTADSDCQSGFCVKSVSYLWCSVFDLGISISTCCNTRCNPNMSCSGSGLSAYATYSSCDTGTCTRTNNKTN